MTIDQRSLQALDAVIQTQSFAQAAKRLFVTQPAISQRIKQLEIQLGQPILIRTLPYQATPLGEKLLSLLRRTRLIEEHFLGELEQDLSGRLSVALNRDSLETWFIQVLQGLRLLEITDIDIITDDQELTIDYFRKGMVSTCVTSYAKALSGCECELLGHMEYYLVASPAFIEYHFEQQLTLADNLSRAPLLLFDNRDHLHEHYFNHYFNKTIIPKRHHMVPSVQGFKQFALQGYGFGLIPSLDIVDELAQGQLIQLNPGNHWRLPLYWHYWQLPARRYRAFIKQVAQAAKDYLSIAPIN